MRAHDRARLLAGASGYSFKEWKGSFYPDKMKPEEMLRYYSERLPTVEINNTFYRMPKTSGAGELGRRHAGRLPLRDQGFAPHHAHVAARRPRRAAESVDYSTRISRRSATSAARCCSSCRPFLKKDLPRLDASSSRCCPTVIARRSSSATTSWFADDVYDGAEGRRCGAVPLRARGQRAAAAGRDRAVGLRAPAAGELLGRRPARSGRERLAATGWREIYVYFMHEPTAPAYAQALMRAARA